MREQGLEGFGNPMKKAGICSGQNMDNAEKPQARCGRDGFCLAVPELP